MSVLFVQVYNAAVAHDQVISDKALDVLQNLREDYVVSLSCIDEDGPSGNSDKTSLNNLISPLHTTNAGGASNLSSKGGFSGAGVGDTHGSAPGQTSLSISRHSSRANLLSGRGGTTTTTTTAATTTTNNNNNDNTTSSNPNTVNSGKPSKGKKLDKGRFTYTGEDANLQADPRDKDDGDDNDYGGDDGGKDNDDHDGFDFSSESDEVIHLLWINRVRVRVGVRINLFFYFIYIYGLKKTLLLCNHMYP